MQTIDELRLESDIHYRFNYVAKFIGFDESDIEAIQGMASALAPIVPRLVDAVYDRLFYFDATKRHFLPQQSGYDGELPRDLDSLTLDHDVIKFRKQHLANYLVALVSKPYDATMVKYLNGVGKIHTPEAGHPDVSVPLVQMNALLGYVSDAIVATILLLNLDRKKEARTLRAFNKLLWIQNDLINRHYCRNKTRGATPSEESAVA